MLIIIKTLNPKNAVTAKCDLSYPREINFVLLPIYSDTKWSSNVLEFYLNSSPQNLRLNNLMFRQNVVSCENYDLLFHGKRKDSFMKLTESILVEYDPVLKNSYVPSSIEKSALKVHRRL